MKNQCFMTLSICMWSRETEMYYTSSEPSPLSTLWTTNPTGGICLSIVSVCVRIYVCMFVRARGLGCLRPCMCESMCLTVRVYVCHAAAAPHLPQPPCWLFHWWQDASYPPHHQKNGWCCRPKILFVALPSGITINNHDIIPFLSMGRPMLIDSMAPAV